MSAWAHPRIENPFAGRDYRSAMAREAVEALARRHLHYPTWVDNGDLDHDFAAQDIAAWEAIAEDWNWITAGPGEPLDPSDWPSHWADVKARAASTLRIRIDALNTAIGRFFEDYDDHAATVRPGQLGKLRRQITLLAAMRCWAEHETDPDAGMHARDFASIGHEFRALRGAYVSEQRSIAA